MSQELRNRLKAAREKLGMSQSQFARKLQMSVRTLQSWEMDRSAPRGFALKALEEKLDQILAE